MGSEKENSSLEKETKLLVAKAILAGETGVGKTSVRRSYFGEGFVVDHISTLGADFAIKRVPLNESVSLEFQIWDLAGQMSFNPVRKRFFVGASALFLIFDLTRKESFEKLDDWLADFWVSFDNRKDIPMILIGNKLDLPDRAVTDQDMTEFWERVKKNYPDFSGETFTIKTSAKTGENINEAFEKMSNALLTLYQKEAE